MHALNDGAVQVNDKMGAGAGFAFEITPILKRRGVWVCNVVDNDVVEAFEFGTRT